MNKSFFSQHYLEKRLPELAVWQEELQVQFAKTQARWQRAHQYGFNPAFNPSLPSYATSHVLVLEDNANQIVVGGGG